MATGPELISDIVLDGVNGLSKFTSSLIGYQERVVNGVFNETLYEYQEHAFPSDVGTEQNAHYVEMRAYTGGTTSSGSYNPPTSNRWTGRIFIPDGAGGGNMPLIYENQHNYSDIRLTNIINDSLLGVAFSLTTRRAINPMVQTLYRSTNLRQFQFGFLMTPKNQNEAKTIENMVRSIRGYAAPEIQTVAVISPAEFEFKFMRGNQENPHLPKIDRCVITQVTANFGPAGTFTAYKDGYPQSCLLSFTAVEIRLLDRTKIFQQGF